MDTILFLRPLTRANKRRPLSKLLSYISRKLNQLWRQCTAEFIKTAIGSMGVRTGMARASFLPLAARAKVKNQVIGLILGGSSRPKSYSKLGDRSAPLTTASRSAGENLGRKAAFLGLSTPQRLTMMLSFDIVVTQHYLHESTGLWTGGKNWKSLEKGMQAFLTYWDDNVIDFIDPMTINMFILTGVLPNARR